MAIFGEARTRRLEALKTEDAAANARQCLTDVWHARKRSIDGILVRSQLLYRSKQSQQADPPPIASLIRKRQGKALGLYLLMLFIAQCRAHQHGQRFRSDLPITRGTDMTPSWRDLTGWHAYADGDTRSSLATAKDNRERQLLKAFQALEQLGLIEANGTERGLQRFDQFWLQSETAPVYEPERYLAPSSILDPNKPFEYVQIPPSFFTCGWIHALEGSEIATWLVFRHLRSRFAPSDPSQPVYRPAKDRVAEYGLRRDSYEAAFKVLTAAKLMDQIVDPIYDPAFEATRKGRGRHPHRFVLHDDGLNSAAVETLLNVEESDGLVRDPADSWSRNL